MNGEGAHRGVTVSVISSRDSRSPVGSFGGKRAFARKQPLRVKRALGAAWWMVAALGTQLAAGCVELRLPDPDAVYVAFGDSAEIRSFPGPEKEFCCQISLQCEIIHNF